VSVEQATLRSGAIVLVVVNNSQETARVAQVILNDAFVDFRQSQKAVRREMRNGSRCPTHGSPASPTTFS
jgi:hypothetical protein